MTLRSSDRSTAPGRSTRRALIIVDLTYGFTDPSLPLGCLAEDALVLLGGERDATEESA